MIFTTISDVETYLQKFTAKSKLITGKDITVGRMLALLAHVGSPHERLKVVHVAGTSGKTSTVYYIARLLNQAGCSVGSTVSPHVYSLTERLQLNGQPIEEAEFCQLFTEFSSIIGEDPDASYFEFILTFVFWVFDQKKVEYVVLETGLGGLHDGSNVCSREDKICVITDIGFDHQHILGNTLGEIARQKAGIIHEKNHVFMYHQPAEVMREVAAQVKKMNAHIHYAETREQTTDSLPKYQWRNWSLAKEVFDYLSARDGLNKLTSEELAQTQVSVPGRMQYIQKGGKCFILDGAHNEQKMRAFVDSFKKRFPLQKVPVLLVMKQDKDYKKAIELLHEVTDEIYCAEFNAQQDIPVISVSSEELVEACKVAGVARVHRMDSIKDAVQELINHQSDICIVTGSFYMLHIAQEAIFDC